MNPSAISRTLWTEALALLGAAVLVSATLAPAYGQAPCAPSSVPGSPGSVTTGKGEPLNAERPPENLSNRLAESGGVLCPPPAVDPEIRLPTPDTGANMPVIKPPAGPGSDPGAPPSRPQ